MTPSFLSFPSLVLLLLLLLPSSLHSFQTFRFSPPPSTSMSTSTSLPMIKPHKPVSSASFAGLGLKRRYKAALKKLGHARPTPVQSESVELIASGSSVAVCAETGTGKTLAYALPLVQLLDEGELEGHVLGGEEVNLNRSYVRSLVLAPTRELCLQITECFKVSE